MRKKCTCNFVAYRNNFDGTRDYKLVGKPSCRVCRGSGWVETCPECDGTGMLNSLPCEKCGGHGKVRAA